MKAPGRGSREAASGVQSTSEPELCNDPSSEKKLLLDSFSDPKHVVCETDPTSCLEAEVAPPSPASDESSSGDCKEGGNEGGSEGGNDGGAGDCHEGTSGGDKDGGDVNMSAGREGGDGGACVDRNGACHNGGGVAGIAANNCCSSGGKTGDAVGGGGGA